jgi:hypothetical protein
MSEKTTPSSHPSAPTPEPTPYPEIAEQAQRLADEGEDVPTLPEVPPLPVAAAAPPIPPAPPSKDPESVLVRVCIALACLFFVALFVLAFTCQRR